MLCPSDGFQQIGRQAKMAAWIATKKYTALDLGMPHLVWKFYEKSCFCFLDTVNQPITI